MQLRWKLPVPLDPQFSLVIDRESDQAGGQKYRKTSKDGVRVVHSQQSRRWYVICLEFDVRAKVWP